MNVLIEKQAAIDAAIEAADEWDGGCNPEREKAIRTAIMALPAVHPEPSKMGKWIDDGDPLMITCGNCGYGVMRYNNTPFCPNCGAKMEDTDDRYD